MRARLIEEGSPQSVAPHKQSHIAGPDALTAQELGGAPAVHDHDSRYYTETETNNLLAGKSDVGHAHAQLHDRNHNLFSSDHPDIDVTDVRADNDVLTWNATAGKYEHRAPGAVVDASETQKGVVEHATAAEVQAGATGNLVATVARLKAELDRREAQEAVIAPSLTSGWLDFGPTYQGAGYYKDRSGRVHISGLVKSGTTGTAATIFTLPVGYRPAADQRFAQAGAGGTLAVVDVLSDGRVVPVVVTNNANLSLSASFRAA